VAPAPAFVTKKLIAAAERAERHGRQPDGDSRHHGRTEAQNIFPRADRQVQKIRHHERRKNGGRRTHTHISSATSGD
jgi:hypothetical protein